MLFSFQFSWRYFSLNWFILLAVDFASCPTRVLKVFCCWSSKRWLRQSYNRGMSSGKSEVSTHLVHRLWPGLSGNWIPCKPQLGGTAASKALALVGAGALHLVSKTGWGSEGAAESTEVCYPASELHRWGRCVRDAVLPPARAMPACLGRVTSAVLSVLFVPFYIAMVSPERGNGLLTWGRALKCLCFLKCRWKSQLSSGVPLILATGNILSST